MERSHATQEKESRRGISPALMAAGAVAVLVLALLAYALAAGPSASTQVGSPAPTFQLTALDGSAMDLEAQRGKVTVVNFFASWCDPCRQEAADLEMTWRAYRDQGVQFYGIAYKDADSKAQTFLSEFDVTYPSAVEPGNRTARAYGVTGVPETFVIDREGLLVRHFVGPITSAQLNQELDRLLASQ